jgi:hypothetical protein
MAGFMAAATAMGSLSSGRTMLRRGSMTVCSHRAHRGVREDEVAQQPVRAAPDTVDAWHERQFAGAGVVGPVGLRPDAGVEPGGDHVDDRAVVTSRGGGGKLLVTGIGAERGNNSGLHDLRI